MIKRAQTAIAVFLFVYTALATAANLRITEFLAENDGGLRDSDGDTPDWIEIQNSSGAPINLVGWHLTDTPTNFTKWTFPSTNLPAGGFLVVFASGKDRTNSAQLHTNFRLENGGGYLALVQPDGTTIASEFSYPQQHRNVSFGSGSSNAPPATLLAAGSAAQWLVPFSGSLGTSWTAPGFDASSWSSSTTPLRYDVGILPGSPVLSLDFNARASNDVNNTQTGFSTFVIGGASGTIQTVPITRTYGSISVTISNSGTIGYDDRVRTAPLNNGALTLQNIFRDFVFSRETTGSTNGLDVFITGLVPNQPHDITVWSYDTLSTGNRISDWFANGVLATNDYTFNGSIPPTSDSDYRFTFRATADSAGAILVSGRRDLAANTFSVFINALQVTPVSTTPTTNGNAAAMFGQNSSLFARQTFNASNPASINQLTLRIKYDDGFVAYLNGAEIARRNAPATTDWNSAATAAHSAALSEDILLPTAAESLVTGSNVLAIHALNANASDADFFLEAQLLGTLSTSANNRFFSPSSPGTPNALGFAGVVADTKFSADRGFYDAPFSLSITCATAGVQIRYTTNGSAPSLANGFTFTSPISITGNSFIRAQAFLLDWISSGIDTHSYIFLRDVLRQSNNIPNFPTTWQASYPADYAMDPAIVSHPVYGATISNDLRSIPSLMIVSDHNGLWGPGTGIYPNATSTGTAWERAASVELIAGDGDTEFATTCRIEMHGNASRDNVRTPKHSMRLSFNSDFGPTRLIYDWFGGGVDEHDSIVLRSCGFVDGWAGRYADSGTYTSSETGEMFRGLRYRPENTCYLRDVWVKESFRDMGWTASRTAFVHLYINGLYWGLYEPSERYGATYFALHHGGEDNAWDVLVGHDSGGPPVVVDGSVNDWQTVLNIVNAGITNEAAYAAITNLVDIDNLIDYMMLHIFAESEDWPHHNWYVAHRRATNGVPGTKFVVSVWDQELTLDRLVRRNRINVNNSGGEVYSPGRVYAQLRAWPEFRRHFGDRVHKHLFNGGILTPSNNVARLLAPAAIIRDALVGESARWGDARKTGVPAGQIGTGVTFTRDEWWQPEIDKLATNFFQKLTADNVARFRAGNLYPSIAAPAFNQFGGNVSNGFALAMIHTNASGVIYFTTDGSDPRVYGSGAVAPGAQSFVAPISINTPTMVRARVLQGASWSALVEALFNPPQDLSKLALTEIMYNPPDLGATNGDDFEFIELKNTGTNTLNLLGLTFNNGIDFSWPATTLLVPGEFLVLVRNAAAFATKYPGVAIHGQYGGSLNNPGETLTLAHTFGGNVFSVTYDDAAPWPVTPDGYGFSLVPVNPGVTQAPDDGRKWRASTLVGGSPGADDPAPFVPPILVNELLSNPAGGQVDTVELFNPTPSAVDIGGWFLTDDSNVPMKYRITNGTVIAANSYVLLDEYTHFNPTPGTNNSFAFSAAGEQVYLLSGDANTNLTGYSHGFEFGAADVGVPFARYVNSVGEEQFPAERATTFFNPNAGPYVGKVVINEIHYNPVAGEDEFVELKNVGADPVLLANPLLPGNEADTWKINGLGYSFPTNILIPPQELLLVVSIHPDAFRAKYSVPPSVMVVGPYPNILANDGERLELTRPYLYGTDNPAPQIVEDGVRYNDRAPWPPLADGGGASLQRKFAHHYADDPINWIAAAPTPGRELDTDGDGIPDFWESENGLDPLAANGSGDSDGDGFSNLQEFFAGTNPLSAQSALRFDEVRLSGTNVNLRFTIPSNRVYRVLYKDMLDVPAWSVLQEMDMRRQTRTTSAFDAPTNTSRFYRLATP